jgi:hypothetical protein
MSAASDKKKVLGKYPRAGSQRLKSIPGAPPPYDTDHWRIFDEDGYIANTIGVGLTEESAWRDAESKMVDR